MNEKNLKNIVKPLIKPARNFLITAVGAVGLGEIIHKGREALTRKKAMNAAIRENNRKEAKQDKSEEDGIC
ncbi:hypothetical protein SAMN02910265_02416 [Ruminococcus flavefaciens]|uniref:Uncharacterized protein n=1 Tax=Ruminococcus flavefaciens TaxID=1265 RepID=A0A1H6KQL0_RUMFL|nr:hypothetical protein [Ruminococcus flavefaciens]SEH74146.1 hypothetical protein SAMN02910265_02416 [Ruminococcus flavefaciens]